MYHVESPCLNSGDTDWPISFEVLWTVTSLLQHKMLVSNLHILPIVFCIKANIWIICPLLVVVDHPIPVEAGGHWVIADGCEVGVLAKIFMQLIGVDCILLRK